VHNQNRTLCILPNRVDVGRHFVLTGGFEGLRETYQKLISRVQSFGAYHFNLDEYPEVKQLFSDPKFRRVAKDVCPAHRQFLDPFQFNFIVQVPGQTVPVHLDGVYFEGASKFQFPQWLLAAMKFSGLWEEQFIPQVQVVGYLHQWQPQGADDGAFLYWNDTIQPPHIVLPTPLSGSALDGSQLVHAASVYRREATSLPYIDKDKLHWLRKKLNTEDGGKDWHLSDDEGNELQRYQLEDLRISIVYRARCFASTEDAAAYLEQLHGTDGTGDRVSLKDVLDAFVVELVSRGQLPVGSTVSNTDRLALALKIIDTFIKYPLPDVETALVPWNYCALGRLSPWFKRLLDPIC